MYNYYFIEEMAMQREREIAARTRSPLFTHHPATEPTRRSERTRTEHGGLRLKALSWGKWRHWAHPQEVHCSRAAGVTGNC